jgi:hypothetical protein
VRVLDEGGAPGVQHRDEADASADENGVTFRYKDYRLDGSARYKMMTLTTDEFIRRFLLHVLPIIAVLPQTGQCHRNANGEAAAAAS